MTPANVSTTSGQTHVSAPKYFCFVTYSVIPFCYHRFQVSPFFKIFNGQPPKFLVTIGHTNTHSAFNVGAPPCGCPNPKLGRGNPAPTEACVKYDPEIHQRRSIRLRDYDYSANGAYFVTIRVHVGAGSPSPECLFGEMADGVMVLNDAGQMVAEWWAKLPDKFPGVESDEFIIMPNHFHGVVIITDHVGAGFPRPISGIPRPVLGNDHSAKNGEIQGGKIQDNINQGGETPNNQTQGGEINQGGETPPLRKPTMGQIVGYFKYQTTKQLNLMRDNPGVPVWQRNYYERVLRNERELHGARKYIIENPMKWAMDKENPANEP